MKLKKVMFLGDKTKPPKGYGIAYVPQDSFDVVLYPKPLNMVVRLVWKFDNWLWGGWVLEEDIKKPRLITLEDASKRLAVNKETLRRWDNQGKLRAVRIGGKKDRRYKISDIEKFIEEIK